ncbi:MAG: CHAT domain-containing protein, partial [Bacteroidales bacterium]|nr:CHAT domain-containing protein [Bacteroidales bacterium]
YNEYRKARTKGDFVRAEASLTRILDEAYSLPDYHLAVVRNSLGFVFYETSRFGEALEQYRMADSLCTGSDTRTLNLRIYIYNNLALYFGRLGDYTVALEYHDKGHRLLDSIPSRDEAFFSKLSMLQFNTGVVYYQLGRYTEALEILKKSEKLKESRGHPYLGSVYFNLARVYQNLGNNQLSGQYYLKGIDRWILEFDTLHYELANIYLHYGQFLLEQGNPEDGIAYLEKALLNYEANYGSRHPLTAACYEKMAGFYLEEEDFENALRYLQWALRSVSDNFGELDIFSNPGIESASHDLTLMRILATKAMALEGAAGDRTFNGRKKELLEAALTTNLLSINVLYRIQGSYMSGGSRIYLNSRQKDLFTTGIRLNIKMFQLNGQELFKEQAFLMAARGKSNEMLFEIKTKEWLYLESLSDTMALTALELKQQIDHFSNLIQLERQELKPDTTQLVTWQDRLFYTRDSFNRHMKRLRSDYPQIGHFESLYNDFTLQQIRRNLRRRETLVEYFISGLGLTGSEQLYSFVVTKSECNVHQVPIDSAFYRNLETIMQNLHGFDPYRETQQSYDSLKVALFGIYQQCVQPLEPLFGGRELVIVPDEKLAFIPFDALITRNDPESSPDYAGLPYLLHDHNISYVYNSQLMNQEITKNWRFPRVTAWVPEYNPSGMAGPMNLEGAAEEVKEILKIVKGHSIRQAPDKADAENLLQENAVIHLAMHSLATEGAGGSPYFILDSGRDQSLQNRLYDYEISVLSLSSPMVVLSSCETAGGVLQRGEGIMSLSRSFLQAGAASVVHSLWPVEDTKGTEIMVGFYREMYRGQSKSRALSNAKKQYLATNPPFYTHPYYWATFQVSGDRAALKINWSWVVIPGCVLLFMLGFYFLIRRSFLPSA